MNLLEMINMTVCSEVGYKIADRTEVHCPPRIGEQIVINGSVYRVNDVIHDYDARKFVVIVNEEGKYNKFLK